MRLSRLLLASALLLPTFAHAAVSFPDVSATYAHRTAIMNLAELGVIGGNPDGTFRPYDPVDRAAMLKMLYKAAGLTPDPSKKNCFKDVVAGSWYESFVCDAVARGYVKGYDGNLFKPAHPVSRAEAIKLAVVVFGLEGKAGLNANVKMYGDVGGSDWFASYVHAALALKVLPIAGQDGSLFGPHTLLERGEAAAYIWNALQADGSVAPSPPPPSPTPASSAPSATERERKQNREAADNEEQSRKAAEVYSVNFPWSDARPFVEKESVSYKFRVDKSLVADITAGLATSDKGRISCRLYRLDEQGFSFEYHIGTQDGKTCYLKAALATGEYQLQLQSTTSGANYTVSAKAGTGDGNDGFAEAKVLPIGQLRTDLLDANDLGDWYTFKLKAATTMTLSLQTSEPVPCALYPMSDVDLFGFSGPVCNEPYLFPAGTYYVNIRHPLPRGGKHTYSLMLK